MAKYFRLILGRANQYADLCKSENFVGVSFGLDVDLNGRLPENWKRFNAEFILELQSKHPEKTKISAGLQCGYLWTLSKGVVVGDVLLCPNGKGQYLVGEVVGDYRYCPTSPLPHQRPVEWKHLRIDKTRMPLALQRSCSSIGTVAEVTKHAESIKALLAENLETGPERRADSATPSLETTSGFSLEKQLEDFLVENWAHTELGKDYDIYESEGRVGRQFPTETGPLDILAIKKIKASFSS